MKSFNMSGEQLAELFNEVSSRLKSHGVAVSERELLVFFHRVVDGSKFLGSRFHHWWTVVEDGEIDVGIPERAPYNLVVSRFELKLSDLSSDSARDYGFIPAILDNDEEKKILNEFWNEVVLRLRNNLMRKAM